MFDMNRLFQDFVYGFINRYRERILPEPWRDVRLRRQCEGKIVHLAERLPARLEVRKQDATSTVVVI